MRVRTTISLSREVRARAEAIMAARAFDDFSEFLAALIREEFERRNPLPPCRPSVRDMDETVAKINQGLKRQARLAAKDHPKY